MQQGTELNNVPPFPVWTGDDSAPVTIMPDGSVGTAAPAPVVDPSSIEASIAVAVGKPERTTSIPEGPQESNVKEGEILNPDSVGFFWNKAKLVAWCVCMS